MKFSNDGKNLISIGAHGEKTIAVWTVENGRVLSSTLIGEEVHDLAVLQTQELMFTTVGFSSFKLWKIDPEDTRDLLY